MEERDEINRLSRYERYQQYDINEDEQNKNINIYLDKGYCRQPKKKSNDMTFGCKANFSHLNNYGPAKNHKIKVSPVLKQSRYHK